MLPSGNAWPVFLKQGWPWHWLAGYQVYWKGNFITKSCQTLKARAISTLDYVTTVDFRRKCWKAWGNRVSYWWNTENENVGLKQGFFLFSTRYIFTGDAGHLCGASVGQRWMPPSVSRDAAIVPGWGLWDFQPCPVGLNPFSRHCRPGNPRTLLLSALP